MSITRNDISKTNKYWIPKERYLELKHFCLQYEDYVRRIHGADGLMARGSEYYISSGFSDPTEKLALLRLKNSVRKEMIDSAAKETDEFLSIYILKAVTEDCSYENLRTMYNIPCSRSEYYILYRKFFWILDKNRD